LKKLIICAVSVAALALPSAASAAGNAQSGDSVGNCISDIFYGNEPNSTNGPGGPAEQAPGSQAGTTLPSQSPGPKVTLPNGTVVSGSSIGDYQQLGVNIPKLCQAAFGH